MWSIDLGRKTLLVSLLLCEVNMGNLDVLFKPNAKSMSVSERGYSKGMSTEGRFGDTASDKISMLSS